MPNIKIFLSYHKPSQILKDNVFTPIHVGSALAAPNLQSTKWLQENTISDNSGTNISSKNPNYCELTAQYWVWKNLNKFTDIDYVGFMHYRRHLNFSNKRFKSNKWGVIDEDILTPEYIEKFGLDESTIAKSITGYDIITVERWDVRKAGSKDNYNHYKYSDKKLHISDYERALKILNQKYPEYAVDAKEYNNSYYGYYTNIFVMKRDIFKDYCHWLFDILFEVEKQSNITKYDFQEARIYGYISEWLFGIYLTHMRRLGSVKIKELQRTFIENTEIREGPINVCFASDNNYAKHIGVAIASILKHKNKSDELHFYVLDGGISQENKDKISKLQKIAPFEITYTTIDNDMFAWMPLNGAKHLTNAAYYRLALSNVFPQLSKILYLDCDLIVNTSLAGLYYFNVNDAYCAGVTDILEYDNCRRMKLKKYVNSGVLLINLEKWRQTNTWDTFTKYIKRHISTIVWHDQDVINDVLQKGIIYLDPKWNTQITDYPGGQSNMFRKIGKKAYIMHFISDRKPWTKLSPKWSKYYYKNIICTPWFMDISHYYKMVMRRFIKNVFSIQNSSNGCKKRVRILGVQISWKRKHFILENKLNHMQWQLDQITQKLNSINNKKQ